VVHGGSPGVGHPAHQLATGQLYHPGKLLPRPQTPGRPLITPEIAIMMIVVVVIIIIIIIIIII